MTEPSWRAQRHRTGYRVRDKWMVWWLFLGVPLTVTGMPYNPEMEIQILRLEGSPLFILTLSLEGTPLIWATLSAGSLYKDKGRRKALFFACLPLLVSTSIHSFSGIQQTS